jgi:type I restriction enzyme M protein
LSPPEGRKQYTKTAPIPFEAFADCLVWYSNPKESERAWKVSAEEMLAAGCNLDRKNPNAKPDAAHLPPEQLIESILAKEAKIAAIVGEIKVLLAGEGK